MNKNELACTTMLVGKKASIDGSTMIARNEDYPKPIGPIEFKVVPANSLPSVYKSQDGLEVKLPSHSYRYTAQPIKGNDNHYFEEGGINEKNVAMSATETTFTNDRFMGADPLVAKGVNEENMPTLVLPFINNAREGVKRLGKLIEKYGTGESNGIAFSDKNEVWYLETAGGHHWVAERIPDDAYAIAPNQMMIQDVNFNDPDHFMYSPGLKEFVEKHHLNNHPDSFNFRNIAGTHSTWDAHYNTPRAWYGQKMFNPEVKQSPMSQNIPFIHHTGRKLSVQDVQNFLSSHYQQTPYDPFTHPDLFKHPLFRPIAIDRNAASHIMQIRNDVPDKYAAIEWLSLGFNSYSPFVPFYTNINQTAKNYRTLGKRISMNSAYWMFKSLMIYIEPHYHDFMDEVNDYRTNIQAYALHRIETVDNAVNSLDGAKLTDQLTKSTVKTTNHISDMTLDLISSLMKQCLNMSHINF